jgi:hypothetical protein
VKTPFLRAATSNLSPEPSAQTRISISDAHFFAVETEANFFHRIDQEQSSSDGNVD